jgi:hypothetical protein
MGLGFGGAAQAGELFTPGIEAGASTSGVVCRALNVGKTPREIKMEIFDGTGASTNDTTTEVRPGLALALVDSTAAGSGLGRYCVITFKGGKKLVRGSLYVLDADGTAHGTVQAE